jgi:hypothetical protein
VSQNPSVKQYRVQNIGDKQIELTGEGNNKLWKKAVKLADFTYPWEKEEAPQTVFKALHNDKWLYCFYQVKDADINVYVDKNQKSDVLYSDRVEIFLRRDSDMLPYYGLEIDPHGRVYDYEAFYQGKHDSKWTWPQGHLIIKTSIVKHGYSVEFAISKESLKQLGLLSGNKLEAGLFRGNCIEIIKGSNSNIKWISWMKPDSPTPNFHIPSAFGVLVLE